MLSFPPYLITLLKLIFEGISRITLFKFIRHKVFKSRTRKICGRQPLKCGKVWSIKTFALQIN